MRLVLVESALVAFFATAIGALFACSLLQKLVVEEIDGDRRSGRFIAARCGI